MSTHNVSQKIPQENMTNECKCNNGKYLQKTQIPFPRMREIPPNLVAANILKQIANLGRHTRVERTKLLGIVEAAARDCKRVGVKVNGCKENWRIFRIENAMHDAVLRKFIKSPCREQRNSKVTTRQIQKTRKDVTDQ